MTGSPWTSSVPKSDLPPPDEPLASFPVTGSLSGTSIVIRSKRWQPPGSNTSQLSARFPSEHMEGTPSIKSEPAFLLVLLVLAAISSTKTLCNPPDPASAELSTTHFYTFY